MIPCEFVSSKNKSLSFKSLKIMNIKPNLIIKGVNLLRLKNNPVQISEKDLIKIIKTKTN